MDDLLVSVNDIHIGDRIRRSIKSNDITRGHFAELLGVSESKVDRILQNRTIETSLLYDISKKLGINFFHGTVAIGIQRILVILYIITM